jgi:hypothetical protein
MLGVAFRKKGNDACGRQTLRTGHVRYLQSWIDQLRWQRLKPMEKFPHVTRSGGILNYCPGEGTDVKPSTGNIKALLWLGCGYGDMNYLLLKAQRLAATNTEFVVLQKAP